MTFMHAAGDDPFRQAVDLSPSGVLLVDRAGTILRASREIERLFGYARAELLGLPIERLLPERFREDHAGHRERYFAEPRSRLMAYGGRIHGLRKDGREVPVEISLSAVEAGPDLLVLASIADVSARGARQRHVLYVEDEETLAALGRCQLERLGYRVTVHASSLAALEDFRSRPQEFDGVVTDNAMPGLSGLDLAREIARVRPDLPILMVSGYADGLDEAELAANGVSRVLAKPYTAAELGHVLRALLGAAETAPESSSH